MTLNDLFASPFIRSGTALDAGGLESDFSSPVQNPGITTAFGDEQGFGRLRSLFDFIGDEDFTRSKRNKLMHYANKSVFGRAPLGLSQLFERGIF